MIVYWIGCFLSILIYKYFKKRTVVLSFGIGREKSSDELLVVLSALPLILIAGLRYAVGTDFFSYIREFETISVGGFSRVEPLYYLLNKAIAMLGLSSQWLFMITAIIFCILVYNSIFKESSDPCLSIFLIIGTTFYFMFMNGMRQMIGCAVLLYGMRYIYDKKLVKYVICVVIAAGFHYSCALGIVIYFFDRIKLDIKKSIAIIAVVYLLSGRIISLVETYISQLDYYNSYLTYEKSDLKMWLYINLVIFVFSAFLHDKSNLKQNSCYGCQLAIACLAVFNGKVPLLSRVMWIFCLPQLILIPEMISNIKSPQNRKTIKIIICTLYFAYATYSVVISGSHDANNYQLFFLQ